MRHLFFISFFAAIFTLVPELSQAQMFSVDDDASQRPSSNLSSYLRFGYEPVNFEFKGSLTDLVNTSDLSFTGTAANIGFEAGGFNLNLILGNDITGIEDHNYFMLGIDFLNAFDLFGNRTIAFGLPVQLSSTVTNVQNDQFNDEFSQTSLSVGAGLGTRVVIPNKLNITLSMIPNVGFSSASGGFIGGNVFSLTGKARINFYDLLFGRNISLGYDYLHDSYDIDTDDLDYDLTAHRISLGISL